MPSVLAIAAHPDDIEFVMCGTLLLLKQRGWNIHYFNIADGGLGSSVLDLEACVATRLEEARQAAGQLEAKFYPPIGRDMQLVYSPSLLSKVVAVVRQARPSIVLTHSPIDYMEDHQCACRLAVSAAFARGMPNLISDPPVAPILGDVAIYHAQPHGNVTPLGETVTPDFWVDIQAVLDQKESALACHQSQGQWLEESQAMDSYLQGMRQLSLECGRLSKVFSAAEGWRRHHHLGFCVPGFDPLTQTLSDLIQSAKFA